VEQILAPAAAVSTSLEVTAEMGKLIADETEKWGKVIGSARSHEQALRLFSAASRI